jgi:hypothetical protein
MNGIGQLVIGLLGIATESISLSILLRSGMSGTFGRLLACLATSDILHYICSVAMAIMNVSPNGLSIRGTYFPQFHSIWLMCSTYIFLGLVTERYLALSKPEEYLAASGSSWVKVLKYTLPVLILSFLLHVSTFFEVELGQFYLPDKNITVSWRYTDLMSNTAYLAGYKNGCRIVFRGVLPFVALLILNIKLILAAKKLNQALPDYTPLKKVNVRQFKRLIVTVTINFVNFFLFSVRKVYLLFLIIPKTSVGSCKASPHVATKVIESSQVICLSFNLDNWPISCRILILKVV